MRGEGLLPLSTLGEIVRPANEKAVGKKRADWPYVGLEHLEGGSPDLLGTAHSSVSVSTNSIFRKGDVLFGKLRPYLRKSVSAPFDGYCSTDLLVLRPEEGQNDPGFVAKVLQSEPVFAKAVATSIGTKMPRTSWAALRGLEVFAPSLPEQRRIAEILDTLDEAIRKTEQVIAKLQQMKQGLLHDLLTRGIDENGELRDPERHPEQFKDSSLGRIPEGWEVHSLGALVAGGIANGVFKEPRRVGSGVPLVNVSDLYGPFGVALDRCERFAADHVERSRFAARRGDVFFTRSSLNLVGIAHCNVLRQGTDEAVYECHLMRVRPDFQVANPDFLALYCRTPLARRFLMSRAKQTTMTTISQPDIAPLPVPAPSLSEQAEIIRRFDAVDLRGREEQGVADRLRTLKCGLMNDLLTGRVRTVILSETVA